MDTRTGRIYGSLAVALAAGVPAANLVTGPEAALRELQPLIEERNRKRRTSTAGRREAQHRKARRAQQHASRKRNRR